MHASHVDHGGLFQNNLLELLLIYEMGPWSPTRVGVKKNMHTHHQYICSFFFILELFLSYILHTEILEIALARRNLKGYINCQMFFAYCCAKEKSTIMQVISNSFRLVAQSTPKSLRTTVPKTTTTLTYTTNRVCRRR